LPAFIRQTLIPWLHRSWPVLLLLALPVLLLSPSLFAGRATTAADVLLLSPPWSTDLTTHPILPQNFLLADETFQVSPAVFFSHQAIFSGRFPFWNPYVAGGTPFFAADLPAVLYPLTWLEIILPYPFGMTLATLLKWWLVGLGMYVFTRASLCLARFPALISALSFMLSSFVVDWLLHPIGQAVMLFPWLLWATERALRAPTARRIALLALLEALIGLAGQPEMALHLSLGASVFALWRGLAQVPLAWRLRLRRLAWWAAGMTLGSLLAAVQYLPTLAVVSQSVFHHIRSAYPPYPPLPPEALATWMVPNLWGNPAWLATSWGPSNYNELVFYAGTVALVLAVVALAALRRPKRRSEVAFFAALAVAIAGMLYGIPPFAWLIYLPGLNQDAWTRLGVLAVLGVSVLAGIGCEELLTWSNDGTSPASARTAPRWRRPRNVLAGLVALLLVLLWAAAQFFRPAGWSAAQIGWALLWVAWAILLLWTTSLLVWMRRQGRLTGRIAGATLLALLLCDQLLFAAPYTPQPPARLAYPQTPTITRLQQTIGSERLAAQGPILPPDSTVAYQLHDLRANDPTASERYLAYMLALDPSLRSDTLCCRALTCPSPVLLSVASVAYYATLPDVDANQCARAAPGQPSASGPFVPLWTQGGLTLWRNTQARPRFYFADHIIFSSGEQQTLTELPMLSAAGRDAIIEGAAVAPAAPSTDAGAISVLADQPGEITLRTQTETPRWLIINEGYDPGWQATVDGADQAIHPANEMFQAILVPAGTHTIHLAYHPVAFSLGAWLSGLALLILLSLLAGDWGIRRLWTSERHMQRGGAGG
jgi:hypothetical protein